jgi:protein-disulfide isomerase
MAAGIFSTATAALKSPKGSVLAGGVALAMVWLLGAAGRGSEVIVGHALASPPQAAVPAVPAQAAPIPAPAPAVIAAAAGGFTSEQVQSLQGIIREYLLANPEILADVSKELERKQAAEAAAKAEKFLADNKAKVFTASSDFVLGNAKGDVTVVEFFDYNCGWCKRAIADLQVLTKGDQKVRVVMKEYPIFGGPPSVMAAKAAMASIRQNKYWEFHTALMREKQVTEQNLFVVAERVGLNVARLKTDMADPKIEASIEENIQLGQGLGIEGTPGFVVDAKVNVGYVPADGLKQMLGDVRKTGCKMC